MNATLSLAHSGLNFWEAGRAGEVLEQEVLPAYVPGCRWFGGKARRVRRFQVEESIPLGEAGARAPRLLLVRAEYEEGAAETYLLPLVILPAAEGAIARFADGTVLAEATGEEAFRRELITLLSTGRTLALPDGQVRGEAGPGLPAEAHALPSRVLKVEQSNSSLLFGDAVFMKLFRKVEEGMNPDVEITRFLNEQGATGVPPFAGALLLEQHGRAPRVLALALGLVPNEGDAWAQTLGEVRAFYERVLASESSGDGLAVPGLFAEAEIAPQLVALAGVFVDKVRRLGQRTGEVHRLLASAPAGHAFAPEPFTAADLQALGAGVRKSVETVFGLLPRSPEPLAARLLARKERILALAQGIAALPVQAAKTRTHGDYHLGQVLSSGGDYVIIDFEGEPQRTLAERQEKRSPLRDVAGMLRSFHYAAHSGLGEFEARRAELTPWAEAWAGLMSHAFLRAWLRTTEGAVFLPAEQAQTEALLKAFLLEKAVYEVGYELNNRPTWVHIPVRGILQILGD